MPKSIRKRVKTETKTPTYRLTLEQIKQIKESAVRQAVAESFILMIGLPVMQLWDHHGFQPEDLDKFTDGVMSLYDSYDKGYITLDDVRNAVKEEAGITFDPETTKLTGGKEK